MPISLLVIALGASAGAALRWILGRSLDTLFPMLPLGTLTANLLGGYIIGIAIAWLALHAELSPLLRLFIITGFCGALTTFSTFSAELAVMLQSNRFGWMAAAIVLHVGGTLAMTLLGMGTVSAVRLLSRA